MPTRDRLLAVLVAVLWGVNFLAIHVGLEHFPPLFLAALRFAVIALPTVLLVPRPPVRLRWLLGYGLGFGTLQFLFLFVAMDVGMPTGLASLVLQASAPFTVVLGAVLLRERLTARQAVGIGLAVLGLAAIAAARAQSAALLPVLLTLAGALGWALGNLCSRLAAPPNPLHLALWMSVVPPVPLLAASWAVEGPGAGWDALRAAFTPAGVPGLLAVAYIAGLATVLGTGIWTTLMRRHPAGVVAPYSLLVPVVGMGLAALVLGERPSAVELVAAAVIVGGVLLGTPRVPTAAAPLRGPAVVAVRRPAEPVHPRSGIDHGPAATVGRGGVPVDDAVCAIRPGTDVGRYARLLARTHDALLSGDRPPLDPRRLVARSWQRVRAQGVDPDRREPPGPLDASQVEQRRTRSPLHQVLPELRASLTAVAEDARHVMVVTDADGVLLWREGSTRVRHRADALGFTEGARWTEGAVGTNAIGTALAEDAPVQIFSAEHFVRTHHGWTCTACPVHDPRSGELLGVVDVSGPAETVHPTTVALVGTAVKLAEASLWRCHEKRLDALRTVAAPVLAAGSAPGLVVDDHGWVAAVRGLPSLDRVAVPTAGGPVAVPGLGLCVPEPVPGGWLLRPGSDGRSALRLTLELDARPPRAVVAGTNVWVHPLSTRHAEVLLLLARAGRAGMDAAALSTALYGHVGSLVTIRAEVSRLRKAIGGILLARPYRIAPEVEVVLPDLAASPFVAASTAPAVRALAGR